MSVGTAMVESGQINNAIIVGVDTLTKQVNWNDRSTCILFGDGAGAVILQGQVGTRGILSSALSADGNTGDILFANPTIQMQGKEVFKLAVQAMTDITRKALAAANIQAEQIDWVIPHQANQRILDATVEKMGISNDKLISSVKNHANTSAASIPLALDEAVRAGKIQKNQLLVLTAIGGGMAWGANIVRW
jgi:3-oxoacyl-[acyl-carrier-protein] synthase-3